MAAALAEAAGGGHLDYHQVPCAVEDVHGGGIRAGKLPGRRMEPRNLSEPQGKAVYGIQVSA